MNFVISLFHGIDIFGRGFECEGFCVVRAGEYELGFDVRDLHLPSVAFYKVCVPIFWQIQQFSRKKEKRN
jgi:hypothetical protein